MLSDTSHCGGGVKIHILEGRDEDITEGYNLEQLESPNGGLALQKHTFSCFKCFNSFNSRYVLLDKTGVLNGFMIFLTATFWPVRLSLAELRRTKSASYIDYLAEGGSYQTRPNAPIPTGWRSEYLSPIVNFPSPDQSGAPRVPGSDLKSGAEDLSSYEFRHVDCMLLLCFADYLRSLFERG